GGDYRFAGAVCRAICGAPLLGTPCSCASCLMRNAVLPNRRCGRRRESLECCAVTGGRIGQRFTEIKASLQEFIEQQKMFFVGTAAADGRVNVSPKGMDSLRVLGSNRVVWLNVTGSGNESAAHVLEIPRMTLMFCA